MSADVYSSLLKALAMPDNGKTSCYPVRISAAGAIAELLEVSSSGLSFYWALVSYTMSLMLLSSFLFLDFRMTTRHLSGFLFFKLWLVGSVMMMKRALLCFSFLVRWWKLEMKMLQFISLILFHHWFVHSQSVYLKIWSHGLKCV